MFTLKGSEGVGDCEAGGGILIKLRGENHFAIEIV